MTLTAEVASPEAVSPLVRSQQNLEYAGARAVVETAAVRAQALGVPVNIAVVDLAGALLAFARLDGAPLLSGSIAQDKAYTVAAFNGVPTHAWFGLIEAEPALREGIVHRDRHVIFGGGVPVSRTARRTAWTPSCSPRTCTGPTGSRPRSTSARSG